MEAAADRGTDSWSVVGVTHYGQLREWRGLGSIARPKKRAKRARMLAGLALASVHTRHATQGDVTIQNAHNFPLGRWYASHNGVIWSGNSRVDSLDVLRPWCEANKRQEELDVAESGYGTIARIDPRRKRLQVCRMTDDGALKVTRYASRDLTVYASASGHPTKQTQGYRIDTGHVYDVRPDGLYEAGQRVDLSGSPGYCGGFGKWEDYAWDDYDSDISTPMPTHEKLDTWYERNQDDCVDIQDVPMWELLYVDGYAIRTVYGDVWIAHRDVDCAPPWSQYVLRLDEGKIATRMKDKLARDTSGYYTDQREMFDEYIRPLVTE